MEFCERLQELRKGKKISQMELAEATGLSQSAIAKWELGKADPCSTALIKLAKYFGKSVDYLLCLENEL
ncbi:MAG: helix-turn-helix transcriptional regulator [Clostridia bacterium]|nr:helix-turn-helix transcriptional regulator [Clostridia bacterium]